MTTIPPPTSAQVAPRGRPRDPSRDTAILDSAIDLLVSEGYDRLTMEGVAARAGVGKATIYRRWSSKAELVVDALNVVKPSDATIDTGSLDGDLAALMQHACSPRSELASSVMCSIASVLSREPELLAAFRERFTEPRTARIQALLERARDRGEIADSVDLPLAAGLLPSLMLQQALMTGRPAGRDYADRIVEGVLRPAIGAARTSREADR